MLDHAALEALVKRQFEREMDAGKSWFESCRFRYDAATHVEAVRAYTDDALLPLMQLSQQVFDIYWEPHIAYVAMPSPSVSAYAERVGRHVVIVVHQGLLDLLRLWAVRMVLIDSFLATDDRHGDGNWKAKAVAESCFGLSLALCDRPIRIPNFLVRFAPDAKLSIFQIYAGMLSFVLAHEISHHRLGHTAKLDMGMLRAKAGPHLIVTEQLVYTKRFELEADRAAIATARAERSLFLVAAHTFLENLANIQIVHGNRHLTHPLAANRLEALRASLPADTPAEVVSLYNRVDELAKFHLDTEGLGREYVIAGYQIVVQNAIDRLELLILELNGVDYKDDLVGALLQLHAEDVPDSDYRHELQAFVAAMTPMQRQETAVATLISVIENYLNFLSLGCTPERALAEIDEFRAARNGPLVELPTTLREYVRERVRLDNDVLLPDLQLDDFIARTRRFYAI